MATDANNDDGPQLTELESLQLKANTITDESLESTRRMISLCEDSEGAGMSSIQALEHQGEQLNRIENGMDEMNAEMAEAEKHLTGMEKWCGLCVCPWKRTAKIRDSDGQWAKGANSSTSSKPISSQPKASDNINSNKGPYVKRILNDAREDEMEDNLQSVGDMLGNLKNMAADMGSTIENHNKQIDRINVKGSTVDTRIHVANKQQLEKIEGGMDSINADMQIAEKALKGMELCCGVFPKFWKKTNEFKEDDAIWKGGEDGGVGGGGPPPASMSTMGPQGGYVAKITNDDREEEMEENMQQVSTMIGNLRNMAADMGNEVENQNRQLDRINLKGASNESRVKIANDRAGALLK